MAPACPNFGFVVRFRLRAAVDHDAWRSTFRAELLGARGLVTSASDGDSDLAITGDGFQATDADRDAVLAWLARRTDVERFTVGPLCDVGSLA